MLGKEESGVSAAHINLSSIARTQAELHNQSLRHQCHEAFNKLAHTAA